MQVDRDIAPQFHIKLIVFNLLGVIRKDLSSQLIRLLINIPRAGMNLKSWKISFAKLGRKLKWNSILFVKWWFVVPWALEYLKGIL